MKSINPWLRMGFDMWSLTFDACSVIGLRTLKIAGGGQDAEAEAHTMIREKLMAGIALQTKALTGGLGLTPQTALARTLSHYRPRVRANRRRLSKP